MTIFQCVVYYAVPLTTIFAFYALMARRLFQSAASLPGEQEGHGPARNRQVGSDQPGLAQGHAQGAQGFRQIHVCLCGEVCRADRALRTTAVRRAGPGLAWPCLARLTANTRKFDWFSCLRGPTASACLPGAVRAGYVEGALPEIGPGPLGLRCCCGAARGRTRPRIHCRTAPDSQWPVARGRTAGFDISRPGKPRTINV